MKAYFYASRVGKKERLNAYIKIIQIVKRLGHQIIAKHVLEKDSEKINKQSYKENLEDFIIARKQIQESDVMIVESTFPSNAIGRLTGIALDRLKPVLILSLLKPHELFIGDTNRLLTVKRYDSTNEPKLKKILKNFFEKAKQKALKYKFNLMIDESQNSYLEKQSQQYKISKAEFIRKLISKHENSSLNQK